MLLKLKIHLFDLSCFTVDACTVSHPGFWAESSCYNGIQKWTGDSGMHVYDSSTWDSLKLYIRTSIYCHLRRLKLHRWSGDHRLVTTLFIFKNMYKLHFIKHYLQTHAFLRNNHFSGNTLQLCSLVNIS